MESSRISISAQPWTVEKLAQKFIDGGLFLPDLQRGFVWTADRVKLLFDSLSRGYPIGSLLLWKWTPGDGSEDSPLDVRPWDLSISYPQTPDRPKPNSLYVLDGQQRLTSLLRVVFGSLERRRKAPDPNIFVSLSSDERWSSDRFHLYSASLQGQLKDGLLVPAAVLFARLRKENETKAIQDAVSQWIRPGEDAYNAALDTANSIRNSILNAAVLAYEIDADMNDDVIEIFVRLNRQGVALTPGELASARLTGKMSQFRDNAAATLTADSFKNFAISTSEESQHRRGGFVDADLLIRTALFLGTGYIKYSEAEKSRKKDSNATGHVYDLVEPAWQSATNGLTSSVTTLKSIGIPEGSWLSSRFMLLPMAIASARGHGLPSDFWRAWVLATTLWGHYSKAGETRAQTDARAAAQGDQNALIDSLRQTAKRTSFAPDQEDLANGSVDTGGIALAMLLSLYDRDAASFPSGHRYRAPNPPELEVHHLHPRAKFRKQKQDSSFHPDRTGNLTLLVAADNKALSDTPPSDYGKKNVKPEHFAAHFIPGEADYLAFTPEAYDVFCALREEGIAKEITRIMKRGGLP